jgi:hypothetical protein
MTSFVPSAFFHSFEKVDVSLSVAASRCLELDNLGQRHHSR